MMKIIEAIDELPEQFQLPILKAFEYFRLEIADTVKKSDFDELKAVVKELAEAQKRSEERIGRLETAVAELAEAQKKTEERLNELAETQKRSEERIGRLETAVAELAEAQKKTEERLNELAEAQKRTEQRLEELAEAQKRTEQRLEELAEAQRKTEEEVRKLAEGLRNTRRDLGGLQRTMSYAFENEAFRLLPAFLRSKFQIEIKERFIRQDIRGKEINIFAQGRRNGKDVLIVGESKLRLTDKRELDEIFEEIEEKVEAVKDEYGDVEIVKIIITHYATQGVLRKAEELGVIIIQSFEL